MTNVIDWKEIGKCSYTERPSLGRELDMLKVDKTDPELERRFYLADEEISFMDKVMRFQGDMWYFMDFYERLCSIPHRLPYHLRRMGLRRRHSLMDSVKLCQSSFDSYRHLANEEELEEERKVYESGDFWEHTFYGNKEELFRTPGRGSEPHIVPERGEVLERAMPHVEWLGCYMSYQCNGNNFPEIHLFMDNITRTAERIGCSRLYVVVAVFLHEVCHALFDRFPLLLPKPYIPQVEEPLAECLSLKMLYAFVEVSRYFYPEGSLLDMFDTAYAMVYRKRLFPAIAHYSLGIELFLSSSEADMMYYLYSYYLKEQSADVQQYVGQFANGFPRQPEQPHVVARQLENLLNYRTKQYER